MVVENSVALTIPFWSLPTYFADCEWNGGCIANNPSIWLAWLDPV